MMPLDEQVNEEIVESLNILIDTKNIMSLKHRLPENTEASSFLPQKRAS
jgi:DNA/RNA-binding domain of Phe-tRNA-synthetase-like protein